MADPSHSLFDFGALAATYDRWYETPDGQAHDRQQKAAVLRSLPAARPGDRLLDVGCGTGHWSGFFAERGYEVLGLDISPEMVAVARSRSIPGCCFEVGDACRLPTSNPIYDVVACMAALEFVSEPEAAVTGMVRCVKPGGMVLVGSLNRLAPLNGRRVQAGHAPYASANLPSPGELRSILRPHGRVRMAAAGPAGGAPVPRPVGRLWDWLLMQCGRGTAPFIVAEVRP